MVRRLECRRAHVRPDEPEGQASLACQTLWYCPSCLLIRVCGPSLTFHPSAARATPAPRIEAPVPRPARHAVVGGFLDPRLAEQQLIKVEPDSGTPTPAPHAGPVLRHRPFGSHLHYFPSESRASSRSFTNPDYETSSEYSDPGERARRQYQYTAEDTCAIEDDGPDPAEDTMAVSESTKLKGVYWPGMDIFDSATPEMRRKRNQKKDHSVVEQLQINSQDVEATELIFTPRGSFKRQRRISSSVFDDEEEIEIKTESPRPVFSRPALATMDPNISRRSRQGMRASLFPFQSRTQYDDRRARSGLNFGVGDRAPKRKRAFNVFEDDEISFDQPASFNYLTSGFGHPASPSPVPGYGTYKPLNDPFQQYENKENMFPPLHQPTFGNLHGHQVPAYHYHAYAYGLGQDQQGHQQAGHYLSANNAYPQQPQDDDDDDQRTITAPPSPITS
ncbi:uncharacterized protein M421DRAFT_419584 [Didymella exigua CBS 183.55]|uniref:Uncharacterized protein n=1 Tax=Didymella exigua CBS 183.55 TaxID=1150837 RepID=A0A6A5RRL3_9PLEO|nr:uncharacterized protein M421DRAFT_419584 [Didymella exigua CBS 183.55]KAF1929808.1 hypothetical protein M421DRAFT_419584 [Didymella exigua CBS 183.55]